MSNENVNQMLGWLLENAKETKAFVLEQAPELAREIVAFGFWMNLAGAMFGLLLIIVGVCFVRIACRKRREDERFVWGTLAFLTLMFGAGFVLPCGHNCIEAAVAPKLYLIHYVMDMLKS